MGIMKHIKLFVIITLLMLNCNVQKKTVTNPPRKEVMFHPKTYYNQYRPKRYSPFENYVAPNQINNRGVQYKKKIKPNGN